jgi:hypothetical protein
LGFKDPTLWLFFAGERKSGSSRQGFESLLPAKKHPKMILQIWATFGTNASDYSTIESFLHYWPKIDISQEMLATIYDFAKCLVEIRSNYLTQTLLKFG